MTSVQLEHGGDIIYTKGAADILVKRCTHIID
ncbi:MAG: hypothetical protein K2M48_04745, partial [Clostridiales bacterium]|nr:hypothetical protein [Clostridiales bacterium]